MVIVEYKLDPQDKPRSFNPKTIPSFITDGGYWQNPDGSEKMIGIGSDGDIPDTMVAYTLEELLERQLAIHAKNPMRKGSSLDGNMTTDEVIAAVKAWVDERS